MSGEARRHASDVLAHDAAPAGAHDLEGHLVLRKPEAGMDYAQVRAHVGRPQRPGDDRVECAVVGAAAPAVDQPAARRDVEHFAIDDAVPVAYRLGVEGEPVTDLAPEV